MDTSEVTRPLKETRSCKDCVHQGDSLDTVPMHCWNCSSNSSKPLFEPKQKPEQLDLVPFPSAPGILQDAAAVLKERGQSRDKGDSERSMATIVKIFNAATGLNLTEEQGWKFMLCLKMGRMVGGKFHFDDYMDLVGYSALLAECVALSQLSPAQEPNT